MKSLLTAEQSAKLIELGVSPERASGTCIDFNGAGRYAYVCGEEAQLVRYCVNGHFYVEECRIFTLADILDILPKEIEDYHLSIESFKETHYVTYIRDNNDDYLLPHKDAPELIDALYSLLVWCLENGCMKLN